MSQDASIIARLGLDTAGFRKGLSDAVAQKRGFARDVTGANESVLESEKKVERQLGSLVEKMTQSGSAAGAAAVGIEALAESINLKLGTAVGAAAVLGFAKVLIGIREEAAKAREELDKMLAAGGQSADFSALGEIEGRLANLRKQFDGMTAEKGAWASFKAMFAETKLGGGEGGSFAEIEARMAAKALKVLGEIGEAKDKIAEKAANQTRLMELEAAGLADQAKLEAVRIEYSEKIGAAIASQNLGLVEQLKKQQELAEFLARREIAEKNLAHAEAVIGKYQKELDLADQLTEERIKNGEEVNDHMTKLAQGFLADEKKRGEDLDKHMRSLAEKFRKDEAEKQKEAAEAVIQKWQDVADARDAARQDFVQEKMAGPDAARQAERTRQDEERIGRQFDRIEGQKVRENKAEADANRENLKDALKPRGPLEKDGDLLDPNRKGPLDRADALDRRNAGKLPDGKSPMEKTEGLLEKIEKNTAKLGVNL